MDSPDSAHDVHPMTGASEDVTRREPRRSALWNLFGRRVPRNEIVFFCQMFLVYVVVFVSLYNLSQGRGLDNLWVALLGSSLGYVLPNPSIGSDKSQLINQII
eukprot:TRINITY_DN25838_c0_g2_i2.p2 TRINITY_DN25838_c0_g2~~TRINITY_DN25838_c0_g2_i2.p2  ORF type:complete len:103 (-),score=0.59 TRINITY_DN25838_c0_g2_i2:418-726(-)